MTTPRQSLAYQREALPARVKYLVGVLSHDTQINVLSTHATRELAAEALRQLQEYSHWRDLGVRIFRTDECEVAYCLPRGATGVAP